MSIDLQSFSATDALIHKVINEGVENRVEVNQRLLINKLLARYSSDFVIFRELIQNSDDAQANSFRLEITCNTSNDVSNSQEHNSNKLISQQQQSNSFFNNLGKFFRNRRGNVKVSPDQIINESDDHLQSKNSLNKSLSSKDIAFHNSEITEIRAINNGLTFTEVDWKRVATIAEGNTNADAIVQFECMIFVWKDGKSLTTFHTKLPVEEQSSTTSIILKMRNKHILQTKSTIDTDFIITDENKNDQSSSTAKQQNVSTNDNVAKIDLNQLKAYFVKVLSFTKYINEITILINGLTIFQVNKSKRTLPRSQTTLTFKKFPISINKNDMIHLSSSVHAEQTFTIADGPSITLNHIDVEAIVNIDQKLHDQIRQTLQKSLPPTLHIQILFPHINSFNKLQLLSPTNYDLHSRILNSLIPLKFQNNQILPSGHIFIGLATHQTTGIGMHVHSQFIPTIERINLDLQTPCMKLWNKEILTCAGKITRLIYNHMMHNNLENYDIILASYSFQSTVPETEIGSMLLDGFFSLKTDILIPVKRTPSDSQFSFVPSTQAFTTNSKYIPLFLSIPLVPYDFGRKYFFSILRYHQLIDEILYARILSEIQKSILLSTELVALLNWLCSGEVSSVSCIKQILSYIRFRETTQSSVITLEKLQFYDLSNLSSYLPLPSDVLPANIATQLSCEQLQKQLFLTETSKQHLFNFYFNKNQWKLFCDIKTSSYLLSFISQYWDRLDVSIQNQSKTILSTLNCIPTTQGMKLPHESYVRSPTLSPNLPFITLNIPQNLMEDDNNNDNKVEDDKNASNEQLDNPVSIELLKWIGCRTIQVPEANGAKSTRSNGSSSNFDNEQIFIQDLLKKKKNMSEADLNALKQSKCLTGTTLNSTSEKKNKFIPKDLHFPSVAVQINWPTLNIIDWPDIDPHSPEYVFLREIGVRETPDLSMLIDRIIEEHNDSQRQQPQMTMSEYKLPNGLTFLATHFHQYYRQQWNSSRSDRPFLPSYYPTTIFDQNIDEKDIKVVLLAPNDVYKNESPLFAIPIPDVIKLFENYCDISLIGVKQHPNLLTAFNKLMARKHEILTVQSARKFFTYLSTLEGMDRDSIDHITKQAFIPVSDKNIFLKPSQVFIRSDVSDETQLVGRMDTNGLIDFKNYGADANLFLHKVGVLHYPPPKILAELLLDRQAKYFSGLKDDTNDLLSNKLDVYTACLKQLAYYSKHTNQLDIDLLETRLRNEAWCLGYQTIVKNDGTDCITYKIVKPTEVYLNDDQQHVIDLNPLCAPNDDDLKTFYAKYGSKWLSESVQRTLLHKGNPSTSPRSKLLLELIQQRINILFVNNRGERIHNVNEDRIEILRNNLSVYETEDIQSQLKLQNKKITFKSSACSSCALEYKNNKVELYIRSDVPNIEYFDIANELARFVTKVHDQNIVYRISNILSCGLESLKRQGIPVDRLLQTNDKQLIMIEQQQKVEQEVKTDQNKEQPQLLTKNVQQQSQVKNVQQQHKSKQQQQQNKPDETQKSLAKPIGRLVSSEIQNETVPTYVENNHISNFGQNKSTHRALLSAITKTSRPYTQSELNNKEYVRNETNTSCESVPAAHMTRYKDLFHSIPLCIEENVTVTDKMINQAKQLAYLLTGLATDVFKISVKVIHLFQDIHGSRIAFNLNGSIFFNLRYFEQVFADEFDPLVVTSSDPLLCRVVNSYFMIMCHELTHNKCSGHNLDFISTMELMAVEYMPEKEQFLQLFLFKNYT